jgi:hypothetical protein
MVTTELFYQMDRRKRQSRSQVELNLEITLLQIMLRL